MALDLHQICDATRAVSNKAAQFIMSEIGDVQQSDIEVKDVNSLVSYVDKGAEKIIVNALSELIPEAGFLTEEDTVENQRKDYTWIIDPLDGTTNSLNDVPHFAVSIALSYKDELLVGVVHEVNSDEQFYAWKDGGAYLNGDPIKISAKPNIGDVLIATGFPYTNDYQTEGLFNNIKEWLMRTRGIRRMGSAALDLAYVACGRFGAYYESMLNPWDVAAGTLIVREAGGVVSNYDGNEDQIDGKETLAAAPQFYQEVREILLSNRG